MAPRVSTLEQFYQAFVKMYWHTVPVPKPGTGMLKQRRQSRFLNRLVYLLEGNGSITSTMDAMVLIIRESARRSGCSLVLSDARYRGPHFCLVDLVDVDRITDSSEHRQRQSSTQVLAELLHSGKQSPRFT